MANPRGTFAKRKREMDLKDKAKAKEERRAAKRAEVRDTKGPQIAWDEAVNPTLSSDAPAEMTPPPESSGDSDSND